MNAYRPDGEWLALVPVLAALLAGAGYLLSRRPWSAATLTAAWTSVIGATVLVERATAGQPPGFRMLALIIVVLTGMKGVVAVSLRGRRAALPLRGWLAFGCWVGMRPEAFHRVFARSLPGAAELARRGMASLLAGCGVLLAARAVRSGGVEEQLWGAVLAALLLLVGMSLVLHFGLINLLAAAWRTAGADARPLFRNPLASRTLAEFWNRRWNLAFVEMTAVAVHRPLRGLVGRRTATLAGFLFSGLLHELAISVPVWAGLGGPLLYFVLQGLALIAEERLARWPAWAASPTLTRVWTAAWLVLPLPLLFHAPFRAQILWPLVGAD